MSNICKKSKTITFTMKSLIQDDTSLLEQRIKNFRWTIIPCYDTHGAV
mgnify:CR=1 FL=1